MSGGNGKCKAMFVFVFVMVVVVVLPADLLVMLLVFLLAELPGKFAVCG
tara:strand:+ start:1120 stop:1266 length:147 start_codon:yes stop_codon:yes gene_type:complete